MKDRSELEMDFYSFAAVHPVTKEFITMHIILIFTRRRECVQYKTLQPLVPLPLTFKWQQSFLI